MQSADSDRQTPQGSHTPAKTPPGEAVGLLVAGGVLLFIGLSVGPSLPQTQRFWSLLCSLAGVLLFLVTARGFTVGRLPGWVLRPLRSSSNRFELGPFQVVAVGMAPLLALGAALAAGDGLRMRLPALAIAFWLGGIALAVVPLLPWPLQLRIGPRRELAFVAGLFLVAFLVRAWKVAEIPWPFSSDEASAGLSAVQFLDGFRDNLFGTAWFSFPSLYFYLLSLSVQVFGRTTEALRLPSALAGAAAVVAVYFYARECFGRGAAMAAAGYMAFFHFHIHFSRIGLNNVWDSTFAARFAAVLWRAWIGNHRVFFVLAGLSHGLAQYFYASARALIPLPLVWLAVGALLKRKEIRERLPGLALLVVGLLAVALPLGIFFVQRPQEFTAPFNRVSALGARLEAQAVAGESPARVLLEPAKTSALAFTSTNLRLAFQPNRPMLLLIPATLFLLGVTLLLLNASDLRHLWLALWLLTAVGMATLSQSPPAAQRYVFAAPAVVVVLALPLIQATDWIRQSWRAGAAAIPAVAAVLVAVSALSDLRSYFLEFAPSRPGSDANTETAQRLAVMMREFDPAPQVYFFSGRISLRSHSTLEYLVPGVPGSDVIEPLVGPPSWPLTSTTLFVFIPERTAELAWVQQAYPGGRLYREQVEDMLLFIAYEVRAGPG